MPAIPRIFAIWLAIFGLLLNGAMLPLHAASGPAMAICSIDGAGGTDEASKHVPLHHGARKACDQCCAAMHHIGLPTTEAALIPAPDSVSHDFPHGAAPHVQATTINFRARAPPLSKATFCDT